MWQPNKSNILSVLISIQAMILGAPLPYLNEPAYTNMQINATVIDHKHLIQSKTMRFAMIGWLEDTFASNSREYVWKEISQAYWKHNGAHAMDIVQEWTTENPDLLDFMERKRVKPRKSKPKKGKGKGKASEPDPEPEEPAPEGVNLVAKLAGLLGLPYESKDGAVAGPSKKVNGKRKASYLDHDSLDGMTSPSTLSQLAMTSSGPSSTESFTAAHHPKKKHKAKASDGAQLVETWIYSGARTQKEIRNACKEFGIGAASTVNGSIEKLEKHVNTKGKASKDLVEKWGEMMFMETD